MGKLSDAFEKKKSQKEKQNTISNSEGVRFELYDGKGETINSVKMKDIKTEKSKYNSELISLLRPHSYEAEQFKYLRTSIMFPASGKPYRSVLITSANPGEGKSFVSSNLAISIADSINGHVLLMDCDLRHPTIHSNFGYNDVMGLSEYLSNSVSLSSILLKTQIERLTLLPAGKPPRNPSELISSEKMSKLQNEVKKRYDNRYVIIDSPPPTVASETSIIAKKVDGVIIVVKLESTKREDVQELISIIGKDKLIGVVANYDAVNEIPFLGNSKKSRYRRYSQRNIK